MAIRDFIDPSGVAWQVWEVHPTLNERRKLGKRRSVARASRERRIINVPRFSLATGFDQGWLAFRSDVERRRSPIPDHWEDLSTEGLCALLSGTLFTGRVRRLID